MTQHTSTFTFTTRTRTVRLLPLLSPDYCRNEPNKLRTHRPSPLNHTVWSRQNKDKHLFTGTQRERGRTCSFTRRISLCILSVNTDDTLLEGGTDSHTDTHTHTLWPLGHTQSRTNRWGPFYTLNKWHQAYQQIFFYWLQCSCLWEPGVGPQLKRGPHGVGCMSGGGPHGDIKTHAHKQTHTGGAIYCDSIKCCAVASINIFGWCLEYTSQIFLCYPLHSHYFNFFNVFTSVLWYYEFN